MTQIEIYKSFQFMAELIIAEGLFLSRLKRRRHFPLRAFAAVVLCFLFSWLFPLPVNNAFYVSFMFLTLFCMTIAVSMFLFKEKPINIIFCCIAGYTTQHMTYEMFNLTLNAMSVNADSPMGFYGNNFVPVFSNPLLTILYFYIFIVIYFFVWFFWARKVEGDGKLQVKSVPIFVFVIMLIVVDILLNAVVVYYLASDAQVLYTVVVGIYNIICCFIGLYLQFEVLLRRKLESTLQTVKTLHQKEKEQYESAKENIALINMKCHDLRHQIRKVGEGSLSPDSVKEIEKLISIYDSSVKTGNETLDVILTEKSLLCSKNNIRLSLIVDSTRLNFMKEEEIYSLFGNIIDNAIEAVLNLPQEKRVIGLNVKNVGSLLSVNAHNYYENDLEFESGLPVTTKADKDYHGFGMKSIRYIVEKYGGNLSVAARDGVFDVNILFNTEKNRS